MDVSNTPTAYDGDGHADAAAKVLDDLAARRYETWQASNQAAAAHYAEVKKTLTDSVEVGDSVLAALNALGRGEAAETVRTRDLTDFGDELPIPTLDLPLRSSGLSFRSAPYDFDWTTRVNFGASHAARERGSMEVAGQSGSPGDFASAGAGVGIRFRPRSDTKMVRVAPYRPYAYVWDVDGRRSALAATRGDLNVLVRFLGGDIVRDSRTGLWNDAAFLTSHRGEDDGVDTASQFFFTSPGAEYEIWYWLTSAISYQKGVSFASNKAQARVRWIVIEEFGA